MALCNTVVFFLPPPLKQPESALLWIQSYLTDRAQTVYFNGNYSDIRDVSCGVPQGTCLGPLLYIIFTNDLSLVLNMAKTAMYVDDSTMDTLKKLQNRAACLALHCGYRTSEVAMQNSLAWLHVKNRFITCNVCS